MNNKLFHAAILGFLLSAGCGGGETCGSEEGVAEELTVTAGSDAVVYSEFLVSANNDCPNPDDPSGPTSLTIDGSQVGTGFPLTFCLSAPNIADETTTDVGIDEGLLRIVSVEARIDDCTLRLDRSASLAMTSSFLGLCDNGANEAGFTLVLNGSAGVTRTCPGGTTDESISIDASVRVLPRVR